MTGRWSFKGPNPITGYTVGLELSAHLLPDVVAQVSALGPALANDLPRKAEQSGLSFPMPFPLPRTPQVGPRQLFGVVFDELDRDGTVLKQLSVQANVVTYMTLRYERWKEYWPVAERILKQVAGVVMPRISVSAFVLNATNRFALEGNQADIPIDQLIRKGSKYISPDMLSKKAPCHCLYGFLLQSNQPPGTRIDNLNISIGGTEAEGRHYWADITISFRLLMKSPISDTSILFGDEEGPDSAAGIFQKLHEANNMLFADVLKQEICRNIPGLPHAH